MPKDFSGTVAGNRHFRGTFAVAIFRPKAWQLRINPIWLECLLRVTKIGRCNSRVARCVGGDCVDANHHVDGADGV